MKAYFQEDGTLVIQPQKVVECIALESWLQVNGKNPLPKGLLVCVGLPEKKQKKVKKQK